MFNQGLDATNPCLQELDSLLRASKHCLDVFRKYVRYDHLEGVVGSLGCVHRLAIVVSHMRPVVQPWIAR